MSDFNIPYYNFQLPWFMFDLANKQLITSQTIPGDIKDSKDIILTETPIPGLNYAPIQSSGNGNRKISFTLPLMRKNNTVGNLLLLKQFHTLRNQGKGISQIFSSQFTPNPKVLYYWGTGSVPMIYYVKKCDPTNRQGWVNQQGFPQYSEIDIELWLDEENALYKAEELYRKVVAITGGVLNSFDTIAGGGKTF